MKKLKDPESHLEPFLVRADRLRSHLGPVLVQLPPHWRADPGRLDAFLDQAPGRHRWAVEFRDPPWLCGEVFDVLGRHNTALCVHDMIPDHPKHLTTHWTYLRFHGNDYSGRYTHQLLTAWAQWIAGQQAQGTDTYVYFNNDAEGHAVEDARRLRRYAENRIDHK